MSHWSFVLMGMHLGLHIPAMTAGMNIGGRKRIAAFVVFCCAAGAGLVLFLRSGMLNYMFFRAAFAFLNYETPAALVLLENVLMLLFWALIGERVSKLGKRSRLHAGGSDARAKQR